MALSIGVDIGGTKIAAGVVDEKGTIVAHEQVVTPAQDPEALAAAVGDAVNALRREHDAPTVGIGAAGFVDKARSTVLFAPNIKWEHEPLAARVQDRVEGAVVVENDANAAAWGEFRFGAGADVDDLLLVTVGTGIGGGIVQDGALFRGGFGVAGEIGHLRVVRAGIQCGCHQYGCWEQYGSGRALVREAQDRIRAGMADARPLAAMVEDDPERITGPMVTEAAREGVPLAQELIADVGQWLGEGIATLVAVLDPAVVAIGGGVAAAGDLLMRPLASAYWRAVPAGPNRPATDLRFASLGNEAGMIGAADLART